MELTVSFIELLHQFVAVFTTPTFLTFVEVVTGWFFPIVIVIVTEIIFAGGNLDNGHWCRFHRFFSHAAWDLDHFALHAGQIGGSRARPGADFVLGGG